MSTRKALKALVEARRGVIVPGAFNALSARVIADLVSGRKPEIDATDLAISRYA